MAEIDRDTLDTQTGGDADLAREVLGLFAGECRRLLPGLIDPSLPSGRRADIAHTLRGAAAGLGAGRVQRLAGEAEDGLRAGAADSEARVAALDAAIRDAVAEIEGG